MTGYWTEFDGPDRVASAIATTESILTIRFRASEHDAKDATAEAVLRMLRGTRRAGETFEIAMVWAAKSVLGKTRARRAKRAELELSIFDQPDEPETDDDADEAQTLSERVAFIARLRKTLTTEERDYLDLRLAGKSRAQAAEELDLTTKQVNAIHRRVQYKAERLAGLR